MLQLLERDLAGNLPFLLKADVFELDKFLLGRPAIRPWDGPWLANGIGLSDDLRRLLLGWLQVSAQPSKECERDVTNLLVDQEVLVPLVVRLAKGTLALSES